MSAANRLLIVGCGYVGTRLAVQARNTYRVTALVRSEARKKTLQELGVPVSTHDFDHAEPVADWQVDIADATIVYLVPPPGDGDSDTRLHLFLHALTGKPNALIYFSTTGVYGDLEGGEVDESTPVNPTTTRALRRVSAEEMTRVWCTENEVRRVVFRVPGIYGPGRLPLERLRQREPAIHSAEAGMSNRIHVDDLVAATLKAIGTPVRGVFNVTDGTGCSATQYLQKVALLAGLPPPPQISIDEARLTLSPSRMSFLEESRRASNQRMLRELGVMLRYASVDDGIRASLEEEKGVVTRG